MKDNLHSTGIKSHFTDEDNGDFLNNLDYEKIFLVLKRSIPWIVAILFVTNLLAYLYIRYTKPLYQSHSDLKLDIKSEASLFGFNAPIENPANITNLSGEIELIKSRLFYSKVIKILDLDINYFAYGKILNDERYKNSPFKVEYFFKNASFYDKPIDIEILNDYQFKLSYNIDNNEVSNIYEFNHPIVTNDFEFLVELNQPYNPDIISSNYYFTINSERALIDYLESNLNVQPLNFTANTLRISFTDHNKYKSRDLVNAIDTIYLDYTQEEKNKAIKQKIVFLDEQLATTEKQLDLFEDYFENFTIDNKTLNLQTNIGKTIAVMEEIDSQRFELKAKLINLESLSNQISSDSLMHRAPTERQHLPPLINASLEQLKDLLKKRDLLLFSYNENTFAFKKRNQEIALVKQDLSDLLEQHKTEISSQIQKLNARKIELEKDFIGLPSKSTEFSKSKRFYTLYEEFYLSLVQKKNEFEIARAGTVTDFVILSPATLPAAPIYPVNIYIYGIGAVTGLILSLLFIALGYLLHNKVSSQNELEKLTNAPVLGVIPHYKKQKMDYTKLVIEKSSKTALGEAFRSIRTNMEFLNTDIEKKVISITSTISGEGKTFISVNLGAIISLSDQKVVIIDLDMRRPKVHLAFSDEPLSNKGVSTILIKKHNIEECILPTRLPNLNYIPAGPTPPNPSELILSGSFNEMLNKLKEIYDIIILDTPPVGMVTDGILAMKKADLAIYVVRADYSKRVFLHTLNRLIQVNKLDNISVILNSIETTRNQGYGYGYGYENSYYDNSPPKSKVSRIKELIFKG
ncbi:MAG: polysaccharide biosynthesis tyrosine autokinase [Bacteroidota bacterium]|nr:polysaccharide biosynthesis tyrosine autokinase [Bacteroidota bacterium]